MWASYHPAIGSSIPFEDVVGMMLSGSRSVENGLRKGDFRPVKAVFPAAFSPK
jgi:hypothetical protein